MAHKRETKSATQRHQYTRRGTLAALGAVAGFGWSYRADRSFEDSDRDGIPDEDKTSGTFHQRLEELYGDDVDPLELGRTDFLIDARYVGDARIDESVQRFLERRFRSNGIHMQWLDYPERYDRDWFEEQFDNDVRRILWARESFYHSVVEEWLADVAFQLVVVPGATDPPYEGMVYSPAADHAMPEYETGWANGVNVGNRAVIGDRESRREQARLAFHEIAHLRLCHDDDPANRGVMGTNERLDLTDDEWATLRDGLHAVRDTTGYDVVLRPCLWRDQVSSICSGCR